MKDEKETKVKEIHDAMMHQVSNVIGRLSLTSVRREKRDGRILYFLDTTQGCVKLGTIEGLTNWKKFRNAVADSVGVWLREPPDKNHWDHIVQLLLTIANPSATRALQLEENKDKDQPE